AAAVEGDDVALAGARSANGHAAPVGDDQTDPLITEVDGSGHVGADLVPLDGERAGAAADRDTLAVVGLVDGPRDHVAGYCGRAGTGELDARTLISHSQRPGYVGADEISSDGDVVDSYIDQTYPAKAVAGDQVPSGRCSVANRDVGCTVCNTDP